MAVSIARSGLLLAIGVAIIALVACLCDASSSVSCLLPLPKPSSPTEDGMVNAPNFGHDMLKYFYMKPGYWNMNHGAFGSVCRDAATAEQTFYTEMESDANIWYRGVYQKYLDDVRTQLSSYVNAKMADLVLVENASSAVNAILRSLADTLPFNKGDKIMHMNIAYPMVKNVIQYLAHARSLQIINVTIPFPLVNGDEDFLAPMRTALAANPGVKLVSLDHIASYPSAILPIKKLVSLCHSYGALVLVDGAHALGQIPVDITDIDADFYLANAHKWLYAPKGSAFLWVRPTLQKYISPAVISSEFDETSSMWLRFQYVGTRNYNAVLAIGAAMKFRATIGETAILQYIHNNGWSAANAIAKLWHTSLLVPVEAMNGALFSIALPPKAQNGTVAYGTQAALLKQYDTYVQLGNVVTTNGSLLWFIRISSQIYLELADFTLMAQRFLDIMNTM